MDNENTNHGAANMNTNDQATLRRLDIKEIAKMLRADIKKMQKMGLFAGMKTSVRISRYSGGQSLNVEITKWDGQLHNPAWIAADPAYRYEVNRWTRMASKAVKVLERMADRWNYDNSDSMTDYFDVNYYTNVAIDFSMANQVLKAEEAAQRAAA